MSERINERCPSCGNQTLFVGTGGLLVCSWLKCKNPGAAHDRLADDRTINERLIEIERKIDDAIAALPQEVVRL